MSPNHAFRRIDDLVVYRQTSGTLSDAAWNEFLAALTSGEGVGRLRVLVVTDGAGPNAEQRKRLKDTLGSSHPRTAVVTDSVTTRFVVSSIAFITPHIRTFKASELESAFDHLGLDAGRRKLAERTLRELTEYVTAGGKPAARAPGITP